jgi:16S rRNA C967 or C1407 C5-methylase (RsmB/RsmF family)/NOL1/NOP2/fmu family ribosome biogenesis protein
MDRDLIQDALGPLRMSAPELESFASSLTALPRPAIRLRPGLERDSLPFPAQRVEWHERGCFVSEQVRPAAFVHYGAGDYFIQDASSLLAIAALDARGGESICDLCAAPGGKSTAILDALEAGGWLLANEAVHSRVALLRYQLARYGVPRFGLSNRDPDTLADRCEEAFDAVLVDAPCSGQSLLGRGKQTESSFLPATISHCAARQSRILEAAGRLVRPGGRMVYSTCTFAYLENESRVEEFLSLHGDWEIAPQPRLEAWTSSSLNGCYRLWPHRDGCGGAFAAVLRKRAPAGADEVLRAADASHAKPLAGMPPWLSSALTEWGELGACAVRCERDRCFAWPEVPPAEFGESVEGPEIAFLKGSTWFPAHSLAVRRDSRWSAAGTAVLDDVQAAAYLRGEVVPLASRGWAVAVWRGRPLGWLKADGRQGKNHLPKPARLVGRLTV